MRKIVIAGLVCLLICLLGSTAFTQDWTTLPVIIDAAGNYTIDVDTVLANYDLAKNAKDSANVDSCRVALSIVQINADDAVLDGDGKVIYGPGEPGDYYDVQAIWPNRIYGNWGDPQPLFKNIVIKNVTIEQANKGVYMTKVRNGLIDDVTFKNCMQGAYINSRGVVDASNCVVQNSTFIDCDDRIIYVRGREHKFLHNTFINNRLALGKGEAFRIERTRTEDTKGILVKGNEITGNSNLKIGIRAERSSGNVYEDNVITGVTQTGIFLAGNAPDDMSNANIFNKNTIVLTPADGATGVEFNAAMHNNFDMLSIDGADIALYVHGGSKENLIINSEIKNSQSLDVKLEDNSSLFLIDTDVDTNKVMVENGSALFLGEGVHLIIEMAATFDIDLDGTELSVICNQNGDVVGTYTFDGENPVPIYMALEGVSASGYFMTRDFSIVAKSPTGVHMGTLAKGKGLTAAGLSDISEQRYMMVVDEFAWDLPSFVEVPGVYTLDVDTLRANYGLARTAEDSAKVDSCRVHLSVVELNADDVVFNGDGNVIYGPGEPGDYYDVQAIWLNRNYGAEGDPEGLLHSIMVSDVVVAQANKGFYLTKVAEAVVDNCTVVECGTGIHIRSRQVEEAAGCVVQNNTLIDCHDRILYVRGPGHKFLGNTIVNNTPALAKGEGIRVERTRQEFTHDVLVMGNVFQGNSNLKIGIRAERSSANVYKENRISGMTQAGVHVEGNPPLDPANFNTFSKTEIVLAETDSAVGVNFNKFASYNMFDSLLVQNAKVAIAANAGSKYNVIQNAMLQNSTALDVEVKGNSSIILHNVLFDPKKASVEAGSAIFVGKPITVDVLALYMGLVPFTDAELVVTDANGDTLCGAMTHSESGTAMVRFTLDAILASGLKKYVNPLTFTVFRKVNDILIIDEVTKEITNDASVEIMVTDPKKTLVDAGALATPTEFALSQNYPNPFNPETQISYQLPYDCDASLKIYNINGQLIRTIVDEHKTSGYWTATWNGRDDFGNEVSSGVYYYVFEAEEFRDAKRLTFLK